MSKIEVNKIGPQCGTTLTVGCGAGQTVAVDANTVTIGRCGGTVALASGATQSGFGRTGTVDWITSIKTNSDSPLTVANGKGYFLNTTGGTITVNLPAGSAGDIVAFKDYANTWDTSAVTVTPNGTDKIGGVAGNLSLSTESQSVTLIFTDSTRGWLDIHDSQANAAGATFVCATGGNATVTCSNFKTHIFTSPGTFTINSVSSCAAFNKADYVVVAGGGGGGWDTSGGGGAGGMRFFSTAPGSNSPINNSGASPNTEVTLAASPMPIAVGGGGAGMTSAPPGTGGAGSTSSFGPVSSAGGGGGGKCGTTGANGGSGGGGGRNGGGAGSGNTPSVSPPQGNNGQPGNPGGAAGGGGGGGAGGVGAAGVPDGTDPAGFGGPGSYIADSFIGPTAPSYGESGPVSSTRYFAGGAGGGVRNLSPNASVNNDGGVGGGGDGARPGRCTGTVGVVNTGGGGGGGGGPGPASSGGSGIVMIRYRFQ